MSSTSRGRWSGKFWKYGVPFGLLCVGGSLGLQQFMKLRYQYVDSRNSRVLPAEMERLGIEMKKPEESTIEKVYEKMIEDKNKADPDLDDWVNVRGPRPWEDNKEYNELRKSKGLKEF